MIWLGLLLVVAGVALVGIGIAALRGALPLQGIVGIRTKATMESQQAWDAAHQAGGGWVIAAGAVFALGGVAVMFAETEDEAAWISLGAALVGLIPVLIGGFLGHRAAQEAVR
ncbi:MAG: SdpI family protein [Acidimicrobiia bacterium]